MDCSGAVAAGRRGRVCVEAGDVLDFAVRFVVHDGDVEEADVAGLWGVFGGGSFGVGDRRVMLTIPN